MIGGSGKGKLGSLITPNKDEKSVEMFGRKRERWGEKGDVRDEERKKREDEWGKGTEREEEGDDQRKEEKR
jgi:hypothetical protein